LRPWDITDLTKITLNERDVRNINKKLDSISQKRPFDALCIEGHFKVIRPDFVKNNSGFSFTNENELSDYNLERYGLRTGNALVSQWREDLAALANKPSDIIAKIDFNAADKIKNGDMRVLESDKLFRINRQKEHRIWT
jgi:hypothetical protein